MEFHVDGCQNYGPFLGTLNIRCRIIIGTKKDHNVDNHPCRVRLKQHGSRIDARLAKRRDDGGEFPETG